MRRSSERGQVITQNVVLAGIMVTITIAILSVLFLPVRETFRNIATCIISDVCKEGTGGPPSEESVRPSCSPVTSDRDACRRIADTFECESECNPTDPRHWELVGKWPFKRFRWIPAVDYENAKALAARHRCCVCGKADDCDGSVTRLCGGGADEECPSREVNVVCVHNDTESWLKDAAETLALVNNVDRLIRQARGEDTGAVIKENDAVKSLKEQIVTQVRAHSQESPPGHVELVAHSEGAAVLANALWELKNSGALTSDELKRLDVVGAGAAEYRFPKPVAVTLYQTVSVFGTGSDPVPGVPMFFGSWDLDNVSVPDVKILPTVCHSVDCHFFGHYIDDVSRRQGPRPAASILVNGIKTTYEGWNGPGGVCEQYEKKRYSK